MSKVKILLVEDDPNLGQVLQEFIQIKGDYEVILARNGEEGLKAFTRHSFDLCILDVMMPVKDGFTLGREIKTINPKVPLIYASAKTMLEDKSIAFKLGADDYITKPFSIEELVLRMEAVLRRANSGDIINNTQTIFQVGKYEFDSQSQTITIEGKVQKLSTKETALLELLCKKKNMVLTREEALLSIWNNDSYFNGRSMDVFLSKIRKYIKEDPEVEIVNIHGKGFKLVAP